MLAIPFTIPLNLSLIFSATFNALNAEISNWNFQNFNQAHLS